MRLRYSRLTHNQTNRLIEHFVAGAPARTAAALIGLNKDAAATFYHRVRIIIAENWAAEAGELAGEVEVVESYFGGVRKGKRGRGAASPASGITTLSQKLKRQFPRSAAEAGPRPRSAAKADGCGPLADRPGSA